MKANLFLTRILVLFISASLVVTSTAGPRLWEMVSPPLATTTPPSARALWLSQEEAKPGTYDQHSQELAVGNGVASPSDDHALREMQETEGQRNPTLEELELALRTTQPLSPNLTQQAPVPAASLALVAAGLEGKQERRKDIEDARKAVIDAWIAGSLAFTEALIAAAERGANHTIGEGTRIKITDRGGSAVGVSKLENGNQPTLFQLKQRVTNLVDGGIILGEPTNGKRDQYLIQLSIHIAQLIDQRPTDLILMGQTERLNALAKNPEELRKWLEPAAAGLEEGSITQIERKEQYRIELIDTWTAGSLAFIKALIQTATDGEEQRIGKGTLIKVVDYAGSSVGVSKLENGNRPTLFKLEQRVTALVNGGIHLEAPGNNRYLIQLSTRAAELLENRTVSGKLSNSTLIKQIRRLNALAKNPEELKRWLEPVAAGLEESWASNPEVVDLLDDFQDPSSRPRVKRLLEITQLLVQQRTLEPNFQRLLRIAAAVDGLDPESTLGKALDKIAFAQPERDLPFVRGILGVEQESGVPDLLPQYLKVARLVEDSEDLATLIRGLHSDKTLNEDIVIVTIGFIRPGHRFHPKFTAFFVGSDEWVGQDQTIVDGAEGLSGIDQFLRLAESAGLEEDPRLFKVFHRRIAESVNSVRALPFEISLNRQGQIRTLTAVPIAQSGPSAPGDRIPFDPEVGEIADHRILRTTPEANLLLANVRTGSFLLFSPGGQVIPQLQVGPGADEASVRNEMHVLMEVIGEHPGAEIELNVTGQTLFGLATVTLEDGGQHRLMVRRERMYHSTLPPERELSVDDAMRIILLYLEKTSSNRLVFSNRLQKIRFEPGPDSSVDPVVWNLPLSEQEMPNLPGQLNWVASFSERQRVDISRVEIALVVEPTALRAGGPIGPGAGLEEPIPLTIQEVRLPSGQILNSNLVFQEIDFQGGEAGTDRLLEVFGFRPNQKLTAIRLYQATNTTLLNQILPALTTSVPESPNDIFAVTDGEKVVLLETREAVNPPYALWSLYEEVKDPTPGGLFGGGERGFSIYPDRVKDRDVVVTLTLPDEVASGATVTATVQPFFAAGLEEEWRDVVAQFLQNTEGLPYQISLEQFAEAQLVTEETDLSILERGGVLIPLTWDSEATRVLPMFRVGPADPNPPLSPDYLSIIKWVNTTTIPDSMEELLLQLDLTDGRLIPDGAPVITALHKTDDKRWFVGQVFIPDAAGLEEVGVGAQEATRRIWDNARVDEVEFPGPIGGPLGTTLKKQALGRNGILANLNFLANQISPNGRLIVSIEGEKASVKIPTAAGLEENQPGVVSEQLLNSLSSEREEWGVITEEWVSLSVDDGQTLITQVAEANAEGSVILLGPNYWEKGIPDQISVTEAWTRLESRSNNHLLAAAPEGLVVVSLESISTKSPDMAVYDDLADRPAPEITDEVLRRAGLPTAGLEEETLLREDSTPTAVARVVSPAVPTAILPVIAQPFFGQGPQAGMEELLFRSSVAELMKQSGENDLREGVDSLMGGGVLQTWTQTLNAFGLQNDYGVIRILTELTYNIKDHVPPSFLPSVQMAIYLEENPAEPDSNFWRLRVEYLDDNPEPWPTSIQRSVLTRVSRGQQTADKGEGLPNLLIWGTGGRPGELVEIEATTIEEVRGQQQSVRRRLEFSGEESQKPRELPELRRQVGTEITINRLIRKSNRPLKEVAQQIRNELAAGLEEGKEQVVGDRRGFLLSVGALAATNALRRFEGLFLNGNPGQMVEDPAVGAVLNIEQGRQQTYVVDLNTLEPAELPPLGRIFVHPDAQVPAIWTNIQQVPIARETALAQAQLAKDARAGDIILLPEGSIQEARNWDTFLRARQLLGIRTTEKILATLQQMSSPELAAFLGALGPNGGLILEAIIQEQTQGERNLIIHA